MPRATEASLCSGALRAALVASATALSSWATVTLPREAVATRTLAATSKARGAWGGGGEGGVSGGDGGGLGGEGGGGAGGGA